MSGRLRIFFLLLAAAILPAPVFAAESLRVGVLEFGTVNWELDVIRRHRLAERENVMLEVVPFASKEAASVAMQANAVDMIVTDVFWVSRQRHNGMDVVFVPHSLAVGGLMVNADAGLDEVDDLHGRKVGVAGGADDKSWLLLRAWSVAENGHDIAKDVEAVFGAPPLLNELLLRQELDAVLNYWHYNARLSAAGVKQLVAVESLLPALGIARTPPLLGWTYEQSFAAEHPAAVKGFLRASKAAKQLLLSSDAEWQRLRPMMNAASEAEFVALRDSYRAGIPRSWDAEDVAATKKMYRVVAAVADETLTGGNKVLAPGTLRAPFVAGEP